MVMTPLKKLRLALAINSKITTLLGFTVSFNGFDKPEYAW